MAVNETLVSMRRRRRPNGREGESSCLLGPSGSLYSHDGSGGMGVIVCTWKEKKNLDEGQGVREGT